MNTCVASLCLIALVTTGASCSCEREPLVAFKPVLFAESGGWLEDKPGLMKDSSFREGLAVVLIGYGHTMRYDHESETIFVHRHMLLDSGMYKGLSDPELRKLGSPEESERELRANYTLKALLTADRLRAIKTEKLSASEADGWKQRRQAPINPGETGTVRSAGLNRHGVEDERALRGRQ